MYQHDLSLITSGTAVLTYDVKLFSTFQNVINYYCKHRILSSLKKLNTNINLKRNCSNINVNTFNLLFHRERKSGVDSNMVRISFTNSSIKYYQ